MDIRIRTSFPTHVKTTKLRRRAGAEGVLSLLTLWAFAAEHKPSGALDGMSDEDVEIAAGWTGEAGVFIRCALEVGYLDRNETGLALHDWAVHQPWVVHSEERRTCARKAVQKRWKKVKDKDLENSVDQIDDTQRIRGVYGPYTEPNTPSPSPSPIPTPTPLPNPKVNDKGKVNDKTPPSPPAGGSPRPGSVLSRLESRKAWAAEQRAKLSDGFGPCVQSAERVLELWEAVYAGFHQGARPVNTRKDKTAARVLGELMLTDECLAECMKLYPGLSVASRVDAEGYPLRYLPEYIEAARQRWLQRERKRREEAEYERYGPPVQKGGEVPPILKALIQQALDAGPSAAEGGVA